MTFENKNLFKWLNSATELEIDSLDFGVIGFNNQMKIRLYNSVEEKNAGFNREKVLNTHVFIDIAQCMNNYMVSLKFETLDIIDETIDYILSFRMRPTPVKLRLLKDKSIDTNYIIIKRNK